MKFHPEAGSSIILRNNGNISTTVHGVTFQTTVFLMFTDVRTQFSRTSIHFNSTCTPRIWSV